MKKIISLIVIIAFAVFLFGCKSAENTSPNTQSDTDTNTKSDNGVKSLQQIFAAKTSKYTVDYTITTQEQTTTQSQTTSMRMAVDGAKFAQTTKSDIIETKWVFDGQSFVSCTAMSGQWSCFKMSMEKTQTANIEELANSGENTNYLGSCSVAGESGLKYDITLKDMVDKSTICYTRDGILLEMTNPKTTMIATKVQRSADPAMFTIPATPKDLITK